MKVRWLVLVMACGAAAAHDRPSGRWTVVPLMGPAVVGTFGGVQPGGFALETNSGSRRVRWAEVAWVEGAAPKEANGGEDRIWADLSGGRRIVGTLADAHQQDVLQFDATVAGTVSVTLDETRVLAFPRRGDDPADLLALTPASSGDRLWLRSPGGLDALNGLLLEVSQEGVVFESALGATTTALRDVAALCLESVGGATGSAAAVDVLAAASDGSLWRGPAADLLGRIPVDRIVHIVPLAGRTALWTVPFADEDPGLLFERGAVWPARRGRSVLGGPILCGGREWPVGIGVHAPSRLAYDLDVTGIFRARVGVTVGGRVRDGRGSVVFEVRGDGATLWKSPVMRRGEDPLDTGAVLLKDIQRLELLVHDAGDMAVGDRAAWLLPLISP